MTDWSGSDSGVGACSSPDVDVVPGSTTGVDGVATFDGDIVSTTGSGGESDEWELGEDKDG